MTRINVIFVCIVISASLCAQSIAQSGSRVGPQSNLNPGLKLKATLVGHRSQVFYVVFSPDGELVATADIETTRVWSTTGNLLFTVDGAAPVFSRDSRVLLTISNKEAKLWDAVTGKLKVTLSQHEREITKASFSPDGRKVATGCYDGMVKLWDVATGRATATLWPAKKKLPRYRIISRAIRVSNNVFVYFSPDLKFIVTKTLDWTRLWDTETGTLLEEFDYFIPRVGFSPDSKWLSFSLKAEGVGLLNLETWKMQTTTEVETYFLTQFTFSPDGRTYVAGSGSKYHATLIDIATGEKRTKIPLYARWGADFISEYLKDADTLSFHPSSKFLMGANQKSVRMWDVSTGQIVLETTEGRDPAALNPDGKLLVTVGKDKKTVLLWEVSNLDNVQ